MKLSQRMFLYLSVFMVFAIPLIFSGTADAKFVGDNAVPNPSTGGWDLPDDKGFCVTGIKSDGTMVIDLSVGNSRPDCIAKTWPTYTTETACKLADKNGANVEGSHYWSTTCVDGSGNGISLKDLDRNTNMCAQNGGTWKSACTSSWVAMGPTWSAAPVSSTQGGTDGFCYTSIRLDNYNSTTCPKVVAGNPGTGTFGYSWDSTNSRCLYAYGIQGKANAALNYKDGSGVYATAGSNVNLSGFTQGQCLAVGASFSNHTTKGGNVIEATADPVNSTIARPITQVRAGCLSCHNNTTQYNGYAGRWKSDYLKTGHKNMLRKVTPGQNWADADGVIFTEATGNQVLDFINGLVDGAYGIGKKLMYIFGDWMAPAPDGLDTIVWRDDQSKAQYNGTGNYSCASCHTTGWSGPAGSGVCVAGGVGKPTSGTGSVTTKTACEALTGGTWYPSTGAQTDAAGNLLGTYAPQEPGASWPAYKNVDNSINGITGRWDIDGITCNRCHNVAYDPTFPINDSGVNAPQGYTTHETDIFDGETIVDTICFSCHQSIAKTNNGTGVDSDLNPVHLQVKNTATSPAYAPEFNSHPIGNMFLNSPHARFTGTILPNKLGKFEVVAGGDFDSTFKGKVCRTSTTAGSGSILETTSTGEFIKTLADCNRANGKNVGDTTSYGYWQDEVGVGNCTTCHNVHESLFDADAKEPIRRECATCHVDDQASYPTATPVASINHPKGAGTPQQHEEIAPSSPCEICHMPKATSGGFPMHVWRINPDASYNTFPTATEFGIGGTATKMIANTSPDDGYNDAVWVDVTRSCGQCHITGSAPAFTVTQLAGAAKGMHGGGSSTSDDCQSCHAPGAGNAPDIDPGVNHHKNVDCISCHANGHNGPLPNKYINSFCLDCHQGGNHHAVPEVTEKCVTCHTIPGVTIPAVDSRDNITTACLGCHNEPQGDKKAIVPSSTYGIDNHHRGSSSRHFASTTNNFGCKGCHGSGQSTLEATGLSGAALCAECHSVTQSGEGKDHHEGTCLDCHKVNGAFSGAVGLGVTSGQVPNCLVCHDGSSTSSNVPGPGPINQGVNHHLGECTECHGEEGGVPAIANWDPSTRDNVVNGCLTCHSEIKPRAQSYGNLTDLDNHHRGHSGTDEGLVEGGISCQACHGLTGGLPTVKATGLAGNNLCIVCHDDVNQTPGLEQNHHRGECTNCHRVDGGFTGTYGAGVTSGQTPDCSMCHANAPKALIQHPTRPVDPTCQNCHAEGGYKPAFAAACNPCHGGSAGPTAPREPGYPYLTAAKLAKAAMVMHKNVAPKAAVMTVNATDQSAKAGLQVRIGDNVTVTDGGSTDENGNLSSIVVAWGDGTPSSTIAPGGTTEPHTYTKAGARTITLVVLDAKGLKATRTAKITVIR